VSFIDESFTSLEALARLGPRAGLRTPEAVDALAAQLILESGLELWKRGRISAEKP
jgi:RNase H-fold protein (predicted Holliday junction resolvase)